MTIFNNNVDLTVSSGCFRGSATAEDILPLIQIKSKLGDKWQLNSSLSIPPNICRTKFNRFPVYCNLIHLKVLINIRLRKLYERKSRQVDCMPLVDCLVFNIA